MKSKATIGMIAGIGLVLLTLSGCGHFGPKNMRDLSASKADTITWEEMYAAYGEPYKTQMVTRDGKRITEHTWLYNYMPIGGYVHQVELTLETNNHGVIVGRKFTPFQSQDWHKK